MKNKFISLGCALLITSSLYAQNLNIEAGWQLKGTETGFENMDIFNESCIDSVWSYDNVNKKWKGFATNETTQQSIKNSSTISELTKIDKNDGFWIKANSSCIITTSINSNPCKQEDALAYAITILHPSGYISSSRNKVFLEKFCFNSTKLTSIKKITIGTFKNQPNIYNMYYSEENRPPNGYSPISYYQNTKYKGLGDPTMYVSDNKEDLINQVNSDIISIQCKRYGNNYSGGNYNRDDNFWTYFCPKEDFINKLKSLEID